MRSSPQVACLPNPESGTQLKKSLLVVQFLFAPSVLAGRQVCRMEAGLRLLEYFQMFPRV